MEEIIKHVADLAKINAGLIQSHAKQLDEIREFVNGEQDRLTTLAELCSQLTLTVKNTVEVQQKQWEIIGLLCNEIVVMKAQNGTKPQAEISKEIKSRIEEIIGSEASHLRIV